MEINSSWMQDKDGAPFAPRTLVESIQNKDGKSLEELLAGGVTPNPEGAATVELKKIKIGDTIFSLPEGGASYEAIETTEDTF